MSQARGWNRRQFLQATGAVGAAALLGRPREAAAAGLNIFSWGWGYSDVVKDVVVPRFTKETPGVDVRLEISTNAAMYPKILASRQSPIVSGGMFNYLYSYRGAADGLWAEFDPRNLPALKHIPAELHPRGTGGYVFSLMPYGISYNPERVDKPKSWADLFDPKYRGKVGLSDLVFDGFMMTAKLVGKDVNDIEAGVREWAKHKENIGPWPKSPAQTHELIDKGELWLAFDFGGLSEGARSRGKKIAFTIPKEGGTPVADILHVLKGFDARTAEQTQRFLGLLLEDDAQRALIKITHVSAVNRNAEIPKELADREGIITARDAVERLHRYDFKYVGENLAKWKDLIDRNLKA